MKTMLFRGREMTIREIAREVGLTSAQLRNRLRKGWSLERATSQKLVPGPKRGSKCKATSFYDCFSCSFPDCKRENVQFDDEPLSVWLAYPPTKQERGDIE